MLRKPKVFLYDEPLSNLDAMMRAQLRVEIARLHQASAAAMLFVTHDQVEAMTLGDRVAVLKDGVIQQCADPETLYREPANAFTASFIGSPGMNLFAGRIGDLAGQTAFLHPLFNWALDPAMEARVKSKMGQPVLFGIRPEDIASSDARIGRNPTISARIGVVERLGGQACLYLEAEGGITFAARPADASGCQAGQAVCLPMDVAKGRFFDKDSGTALA
jgi:multiple sugar transport system ATP-binding protein